jgi:hypothetical protein
MKNGTLVAAALWLLLTGCEKSIDFKLRDETPKLVVEATIENGESPVVILTRSAGYFSKINFDLIANSFVHNADIYISNGTLTHKLKEYTVPTGIGLNLYYYSIDSSSLATAFKGQLEKDYSLRIVAEGLEYTSQTRIPKITKVIDSLWWKPIPNDTLSVQVMIRATDPAGYGDYIRYFTKRNREPYLAPYNSVYDDLFIDGTTYDVQVDHGIDRNASAPNNDESFKHGDTVTMKLCNIDKATFDFWRTMEYSYSSVGNPFSTPTKVLNNISNNALGYFGGFACQYKTIVIPH